MTALIKIHFRKWMELGIHPPMKYDGSHLIPKSINYVSNRYHHDLGIDEVSEFVGLSPSHFFVLFKQETGYTFLEYLTKFRIEKACSILTNPDVKVYQIAPLVGYSRPPLLHTGVQKNYRKNPYSIP